MNLELLFFLILLVLYFVHNFYLTLKENSKRTMILKVETPLVNYKISLEEYFAL